MKFTENRIIVFLIIGACCLITALAQAEEQSTENQSAQVEQVAVPTLSEQEIFQFLKTKFATMHVAPDVNPAVIARLIVDSYQHCTLDDLEFGLQAVQKLAQEQADYQNNVNYWQGLPQSASPVITRQLISSILYDKDEKYAWLVYMFLVNRRSIAVHEVGHAIAIIYQWSKYRALMEVSMVGTGNSQAFVLSNPIGFLHQKSIEDIIELHKQSIIVSLSGGIADQIFGLPIYHALWYPLQWIGLLRQKMDQGLQGILLNDACVHDAHSAEAEAQFLVDHGWTKQTKNEILQECYDLAYQFILDHKADVEKLADLLMKKDVIFAEEVYELLGVERPLFDFEEEIIPEVQATRPAAQPTKKQKALLAAAAKKKALVAAAAKKKKKKGKK